MPELELEPPPVADSIPRAREALDGLAVAVGPERLEDLRLVVSELVTNSVRHAGLGAEQQIDLRVDSTDDRIRVEIHDAGPGFEVPPAPGSLYQESGWGLYLVSRIADRWGIATDSTGTTVWLEIAR
jgi:anti-sigma regulatory factor (Ser/Thr protein kinase)